MTPLYRIHIQTLKAKMRIYDELYEPGNPLPPLNQVVKDKFYKRGDSSRIRCVKCGKRFRGVGPHSTYCDNCELTVDFGLDYYAPGNWSGKLADQHRQYSLGGLLNRDH